MKAPSDFKQGVYEIVGTIPAGRVMTYGQIAALCARPRAARVVGGIARFGPTEIPWHRVVRQGGLVAREFPGGPQQQVMLLEAEGVIINDGKISDFEKRLWWPHD